MHISAGLGHSFSHHLEKKIDKGLCNFLSCLLLRVVAVL